MKRATVFGLQKFAIKALRSLEPAVLLICAGKMQIPGNSASSCSGAASQDMMMVVGVGSMQWQCTQQLLVGVTCDR